MLYRFPLRAPQALQGTRYVKPLPMKPDGIYSLPKVCSAVLTTGFLVSRKYMNLFTFTLMTAFTSPKPPCFTLQNRFVRLIRSHFDCHIKVAKTLCRCRKVSPPQGSACAAYKNAGLLRPCLRNARPLRRLPRPSSGRRAIPSEPSSATLQGSSIVIGARADRTTGSRLVQAVIKTGARAATIVILLRVSSS